MADQKRKLTLDEALEQVTADFPRPERGVWYHERKFYNAILREIAQDVGCDVAEAADDIMSALATQGIWPAWLFDHHNSLRKRKLDRSEYVLAPRESLQYLKYMRKTRQALAEAA